MREIKLRDFTIGGNKLTILAGPCVIESMDIMEETAKTLKEITTKLDINFIFKSSFDKANRSSLDNYRGPGLEKGLKILAEIKEKYGDKLCLWGNIDLDHVMCFGTPEEVKADVRRTIDIASPGGGFILSTCNTMVDIIPTENIIAMMEEAEK